MMSIALHRTALHSLGNPPFWVWKKTSRQRQRMMMTTMIIEAMLTTMMMGSFRRTRRVAVVCIQHIQKTCCRLNPGMFE